VQFPGHQLGSTTNLGQNNLERKGGKGNKIRKRKKEK
jgi:hypothetical protein